MEPDALVSTPGPAPSRGRVIATLILPFLPFAVGWVGKSASPESGAFDPLVLGGFLAIPALGGLMIRLVGSWRILRWTIAFQAVGTATLLAVGIAGSVNEECLEVPEAVWLAVPAALIAGWVIAVAVITSAVARPAGSRERAVAGFIVGAVVTVPLLFAAFLLWNLLPDLPTVPNCEVMHIF